MTSVLSGILLAVGIGVIASLALSEAQRPAFDTFVTPSVRLGDPGSNLVGPEWSEETGDETGS